MTRARMPRPHEVAAARRDPRLLRALSERNLDPSWRMRGACQTVDPETFFPAPSEPADAAVALCRTCEVQGPCLAWALEVGDCHGVWGATTPRERRAMLVAWRADVHGMAAPEQSVVVPRQREPLPAQRLGHDERSTRDEPAAGTPAPSRRLLPLKPVTHVNTCAGRTAVAAADQARDSQPRDPMPINASIEQVEALELLDVDVLRATALDPVGMSGR